MKSRLRRCILLCHVPCNNGHVGRHRLLPGIWESQLVWDCGSWSHRTNSTKTCSATINMFHVQTQQVIPSNNCNQHLSICLFKKIIFVTSSLFLKRDFVSRLWHLFNACTTAVAAKKLRKCWLTFSGVAGLGELRYPTVRFLKLRAPKGSKGSSKPSRLSGPIFRECK